MTKLTLCLLGMIALGVLASGVGWSQTASGDSSGDGKQEPRSDTGDGRERGAYRIPAKDGKEDAISHRIQVEQHNVASPQRYHRSGTTAAPNAGVVAGSAAQPALLRHRATDPRFGFNAKSPVTPVAVAVSAHHVAVKAGLGGAMPYNAERGELVIIGGTSMTRKAPGTRR